MKVLFRAGVAAIAATAVVATLPGTPVLADTEPVVSSTMLAAPTGLTPDDSGQPYPRPVRKSVILDWAPVAGATGYRVQVGIDSSWSDAPVYGADVRFSQAALPVALPNATYVWRVAALKGSAVGHWSSEEGRSQSEATFVKGWREVPLLAPVDPFVVVPTFSWSPVAEASGYEFQASNDPTFGAQGSAEPTTSPTPDTEPSPGTQVQGSPQPELFADCLTGRTRYTPAQTVVGTSDSVGPCNFNFPEPDSVVYWRVRALDAYVDTLEEGAATPVASEGVSYQTYKTTDYSPDLLSGCATDSREPALGLPLECTPLRPSVKSSWSAVSSFVFTGTATPSYSAGPQVVTQSVADDPDSLCTVSNPGANEAEHAVCTDVPTLRWTPVTGKPLYRVVLARDDAFSNILLEEETPALEWTLPGALRDGLYYYAVQACDSDGCGPVTTTPASFVKRTPRLTGLSTPPTTGDFELSWQSYGAALALASGAAETQDAYAYRVQVATDGSYTNVVDDRIVDASARPEDGIARYVPSEDYGDGSYVYRVQPIDSFGSNLPWSYSKAFSRDATAPAITSVSPQFKVTTRPALKVVFSENVTGVSASTLRLSGLAGTVTSVGDGRTFTIRPSSTLRPGGTYVVTVGATVKDLAGNSAVAVGPAVTVNPFADDINVAFSYGGSWRTYSYSNALGGKFHVSSPTRTARTSATLAFTGQGVTVTACKGPSSGYADVYVDGSLKKRVNLYRSYSGCGVTVASVTGLSAGPHTLKVIGLGVRASASRGTYVMLDAVQVTP